MTPEDEWVPVNPKPGAIIVNVGEPLARMTSDRLKAVVSEQCNILSEDLVNMISKITDGITMLLSLGINSRGRVGIRQSNAGNHCGISKCRSS